MFGPRRIEGQVSGGFVNDTASGKFRSSYGQWTNGAQNVVGGLEGMTQFLRETVRKHQELDSQLGQQTGG